MNAYIKYHITWRGIPITIRHCKCWNTTAFLVQYIELISHKRVPLPVTESGYRSHFLLGDDALSDYRDDPAVFVTAWLDYSAKHTQWHGTQQLSLL